MYVCYNLNYSMIFIVLCTINLSSLESQKKEILEIIKEKSCNSDVIQL